MNARELLSGVDLLQREKGVSREVIFSAIEKAIRLAILKRYNEEEGIMVTIDRDNGRIEEQTKKDEKEKETSKEKTKEKNKGKDKDKDEKATAKEKNAVIDVETTYATPELSPIPKTHAPNLLEITESELFVVAATAQRIARAVQKALAPDGIRIVQTNGAAAGQSVFHYHVHIIPMQEGQRIGVHGRTLADSGELDALAARIRAALED